LKTTIKYIKKLFKENASSLLWVDVSSQKENTVLPAKPVGKLKPVINVADYDDKYPKIIITNTKTDKWATKPNINPNRSKGDSNER